MKISSLARIAIFSVAGCSLGSGNSEGTVRGAKVRACFVIVNDEYTMYHDVLLSRPIITICYGATNSTTSRV